MQSPGRDLLITAAHCINDGRGHNRSDIVFVPGYVDGTVPHGVWALRQVIVDPRWAHGANPDYDVGFVVLYPKNGKNIQDVLGAYQIGFHDAYTNQVWVTGYPATASAPVTCKNWTTKQSATQLRFACGGFYRGTSGGPWVATHGIVGVIGGYQRGGNTPAVSYSPYLGTAIEKLYAQAKAAGRLYACRCKPSVRGVVRALRESHRSRRNHQLPRLLAPVQSAAGPRWPSVLRRRTAPAVTVTARRFRARRPSRRRRPGGVAARCWRGRGRCSSRGDDRLALGRGQARQDQGGAAAQVVRDDIAAAQDVDGPCTIATLLSISTLAPILFSSGTRV